MVKAEREIYVIDAPPVIEARHVPVHTAKGVVLFLRKKLFARTEPRPPSPSANSSQTRYLVRTDINNARHVTATHCYEAGSAAPWPDSKPQATHSAKVRSCSETIATPEDIRPQREASDQSSFESRNQATAIGEASTTQASKNSSTHAKQIRKRQKCEKAKKPREQANGAGD